MSSSNCDQCTVSTNKIDSMNRNISISVNYMTQVVWGKARQCKTNQHSEMPCQDWMLWEFHLLWQKIPDTKPSEKSRLQSESSRLTVDWCFPIFSELSWGMPDWTSGRLCCLRKLQHIQSSSENMITHAHLMRRRSNTKGLTPLLCNLEIWRSSPYSSPSQELINRNPFCGRANWPRSSIFNPQSCLSCAWPLSIRTTPHPPKNRCLASTKTILKHKLGQSFATK